MRGKKIRRVKKIDLTKGKEATSLSERSQGIVASDQQRIKI